MRSTRSWWRCLCQSSHLRGVARDRATRSSSLRLVILILPVHCLKEEGDGGGWSSKCEWIIVRLCAHCVWPHNGASESTNILQIVFPFVCFSVLEECRNGFCGLLDRDDDVFAAGNDDDRGSEQRHHLYNKRINSCKPNRGLHGLVLRCFGDNLNWTFDAADMIAIICGKPCEKRDNMLCDGVALFLTNRKGVCNFIKLG